MRLSVSGRTAGIADERSGPESTELSDFRGSPELRNAEQNARRALGLMPGGQGTSVGTMQGRTRRRFARDGEVAVVVLPRSDHATSDSQTPQSATSPATNRIAAAEAARDAESRARQRAERALAEAQAALRSLQTQVRHAAMSQDEVLEAARRAVAERDTLEAALAAERQARQIAEQALAKLLVRRERASETAPPPSVPRVKKPARAKGRAPEPKPVRWWIKPKA
jgi:DNA polymerase III gamma/tau subunit